jgi:RimJ/RimL family protein N-acetyltransferase
MFPEIRTQRLALRDLEASDGPRIFAYHTHPEVSRFQSWGTESVDVIQSYIRSLAVIEPDTPGSWYQVGIFLLPGGKLIGDCGFRVLEAEPRQAEIGITLAPEVQGKGYAGEALQALLHYLLVTLGKHRVFGSVDPENLPSMKLLQRVGMRKEAHFVGAYGSKAHGSMTPSLPSWQASGNPATEGRRGVRLEIYSAATTGILGKENRRRCVRFHLIQEFIALPPKPVHSSHFRELRAISRIDCLASKRSAVEFSIA